MDDQLGADTRRATAAGDAYRLSDARYRGGIDSFLVNLDCQRSLYTAQETLVATPARGARSNRVAALPDPGRRCADARARRADTVRPAEVEPCSLCAGLWALQRERARPFLRPLPAGSAVSLISAIMLGRPCVRLDESWRFRSNGSSAPSISSFGDIGGHAVLHGQQHQCDDALGDRRIAVGEEMERTARYACG